MLLSITSEAPSTASCSFCFTRKHSSWSRVSSKKDRKTLILHTKGTISSPLVLKSKLSLWKWNGCFVWERTSVYLKLCMFKRFVTWFLPKSLSSPSMSAKLVCAHLLGFFDGTEISAGRSPLMNEDLLLGKLGLSLEPQVVAGSVLPEMRVLYGLFGSNVMGTIFCWFFFTHNALLCHTLQLLPVQVGKISLWVENLGSSKHLVLQFPWRIQQPYLVRL